MYKRLPLVAMLFLLGNSRAEAANLAVITNPPTMMNILILGFGIACVGGAFRVYTLVRGGQLSKSWQLFLGGFAVLVLAQLLMIFSAMEIVSLPSFVIPACFVLMAGLFLWGILETKRTLG